MFETGADTWRKTYHYLKFSSVSTWVIHSVTFYPASHQCQCVEFNSTLSAHTMASPGSPLAYFLIADIDLPSSLIFLVTLDLFHFSKAMSHSVPAFPPSLSACCWLHTCLDLVCPCIFSRVWTNHTKLSSLWLNQQHKKYILRTTFKSPIKMGRGGFSSQAFFFFDSLVRKLANEPAVHK